MHENTELLTTLLFFGGFLILTSYLRIVSNKLSFPYTVLLLIVGFIGQALRVLFGLDISINLSSDLIYFFILPLLLFESALHINVHKFLLHFRTLTFLTSFGLLLSVFVVGVGGATLLGLPFLDSLMFGALISATDPIAVLSLFKNIGAPKRLAMLVDGESMFNDATAVIVFRVISASVLGAGVSASQLSFGALDFIVSFFGSILFGYFVGKILSFLLSLVKNDRIVETTLTIALALSTFLFADHFLNLSGVISTVVLGMVVGNLGQTKISSSVIHFMEEFWDYIGFLGVSLVFFFASFSMNLSLFTNNPFDYVIVVFLVLLARMFTVYVTFFITNHLSIFGMEPNVPIRWQHIINWGGLRGVIPLVLVYALPSSYKYRDLLASYTLAALVFTLFVNGTTIKWLLYKLGLHIPRKEEVLIKEELSIFDIESAITRLQRVSRDEFDPSLIKDSYQKLLNEEKSHKKKLLKLATPKELLVSLRLQAIAIEKGIVNDLFMNGEISEPVFYDFESDLDLQEDSIDFPELKNVKRYRKTGLTKSSDRFRRRIELYDTISKRVPILRKFIYKERKIRIVRRFEVLLARQRSSEAVLAYINKVRETLKDSEYIMHAIDVVENDHMKHMNVNGEHLQKLSENYPVVLKQCQKRSLDTFIFCDSKSSRVL